MARKLFPEEYYCVIRSMACRTILSKLNPLLEFVYVGALEWKNLQNSNITLIIIRDNVNTIYLKEVRSNQCFYPQQHNTLCLDD